MTVETCQRCGRSHPAECCPEGGGVTTVPSTPGVGNTAATEDGGPPVAAPRGLPGAPSPVDLFAGATVGEYQVTGLLGEGGMGVVYSGVHPLLGRKVAIKVLNHHMAQRDEATARFLQEARAASTLRHQNIVDVFAFGQLADGRYYQVMEYLEGQSLRAIIAERGPLGRADARTIIIGVLAGLEAAHRRGVVHRDIKPDNIFVCGPLGAGLAAGDVKILDFGLAKRESAADVSVKTRSGVTMGTPAYMSPEQCRGVASVDARTDIYAAGVVLYEMLAGRVPFQSPSAFDVMFMQIKSRPPRLAELLGRFEPFEAVVLKALAKRAEDRFGSAREMLAAIDAVVLPAAEGTQSWPVRSGVDGDGRSPSDLVGAVFRLTQRLRWRRSGVKLAALGVGAALVAVVAAGLVARRRGPASVRSMSSGAAALVAPASVAPRAPAAPAVAPAAVATPTMAVETPAAAAGVAGPAAARAGVRERGAGRGRARGEHGRARNKKGAPAGAGGRAKETDVDSPMNPYGP